MKLYQIEEIVDGHEVSSAIDWWTAKLKASAAERPRFRRALRLALIAKWRPWGRTGNFTWQTGKPGLGIGLRTLMTTDTPDITLWEALRDAGIRTRLNARLPAHTVMKISPGRVVITTTTVIYPPATKVEGQ